MKWVITLTNRLVNEWKKLSRHNRGDAIPFENLIWRLARLMDREGGCEDVAQELPCIGLLALVASILS